MVPGKVNFRFLHFLARDRTEKKLSVVIFMPFGMSFYSMAFSICFSNYCDQHADVKFAFKTRYYVVNFLHGINCNFTLLSHNIRNVISPKICCHGFFDLHKKVRSYNIPKFLSLSKSSSFYSGSLALCAKSTANISSSISDIAFSILGPCYRSFGTKIYLLSP